LYFIHCDIIFNKKYIDNEFDFVDVFSNKISLVRKGRGRGGGMGVEEY